MPSPYRRGNGGGGLVATLNASVPSQAPNQVLSVDKYYRSADVLLRQAREYERQGNEEQKYVMLFRLASLTIETLPGHHGYVATDPRYVRLLRLVRDEALPEVERLRVSLDLRDKARRASVVHAPWAVLKVPGTHRLSAGPVPEVGWDEGDEGSGPDARRDRDGAGTWGEDARGGERSPAELGVGRRGVDPGAWAAAALSPPLPPPTKLSDADVASLDFLGLPSVPTPAPAGGGSGGAGGGGRARGAPEPVAGLPAPPGFAPEPTESAAAFRARLGLRPASHTVRERHALMPAIAPGRGAEADRRGAGTAAVAAAAAAYLAGRGAGVGAGASAGAIAPATGSPSGSYPSILSGRVEVRLPEASPRPPDPLDGSQLRLGPQLMEVTYQRPSDGPPSAGCCADPGPGEPWRAESERRPRHALPPPLPPPDAAHGVPPPPPPPPPPPGAFDPRSASPGVAPGLPTGASAGKVEAKRRQSLRDVHVSAALLEAFFRLAATNTRRRVESCGILAGSLSADDALFTIDTLIVPKQEGSSDTVTALGEEEIFEVQDSRGLYPLGWVHTHPTQTCFLSSIDVHTQCGYQTMLDEAIAIVMAPRDVAKRVGIFRLSTPGGLGLVQRCTGRGFHTHPPTDTGQPLYEFSDHVYLNPRAKFQVIDLR